MKRKPKYLLSCSLAAVAAVSATAALASSHREAPRTAGQPEIDGTDLYMFRSYERGRAGFVTLIANYIPLQVPFAGPNYYTFEEEAIYEIHIDNTGDAVEDVTFQFQFQNELIDEGEGITLQIGDREVPIPLRQAGQITEVLDQDINWRELYSLTMISGDRRSGERRKVRASRGSDGEFDFAKPIDNIGNKTLPDYPSYAREHIYNVNIPGCEGRSRVFVGQREEAFAANLGETFDLVNYIPIEAGFFPDNPNLGIVEDPENGDLINQYNVTSIALEVPISCLTGEGNGVIGGWTTASLPQSIVLDPSPTFDQPAVYGGAFVQQSRLGNPLVNEVVIGLPDKNLFNAAEPTQDSSLAFYVTNPTFPALLEALFLQPLNDALGANLENLAPTFLPRDDLVATFLTGIPGLNQLAEVTPSEILRLNTTIEPKAPDDQSPLGVIGGDLSGFPNGRRPGDDVVDIELRVLMGRLCYPIPIGEELGQAEDEFSLGICAPEDAPVGNVPFTDGAPPATDQLAEFPYLNTPIPGSPDEARNGDN